MKTVRMAAHGALLCLVLAWPPARAASDAPVLASADFHVLTTDNVSIFVREIRPAHAVPGDPVILIHGARAPGLASFDLPVADGSFARTLAARTQRPVYVMDARGYGGSQRPPAMSEAPENRAPLSRAFEVVRDIDAVARAAQKRAGTQRVSLFGWATGGMWAGYYASLHPEQVSHVVLLNALYGAGVPHPRFGAGSSLSDPKQPDRFNPGIGAYSVNDATSLRAVWERSIPEADKDRWRDPAVADALTQATAQSDAEFARQQPGKFRAPSGALEDSFYQATGRRLYDASSITARVLLVRSGLDFWSRPEDQATFLHDASHAASARLLTLPESTHFAHLDRAERGRAQLTDEVVRFLAE